jgi:hypothetical protein
MVAIRHEKCEKKTVLMLHEREIFASGNILHTKFQFYQTFFAYTVDKLSFFPDGI